MRWGRTSSRQDGSLASTGRYIKNGYVDWKLGIPGIVMSLVGSHFGTKLQLMVPEKYLQYLLLLVLPVVAFVVLRQRQLPEERGQIEPKAQMAIVCVSTFFIGAYDGFYGPGTGTILMLLLAAMAHQDVRTAAGTTKAINLATNVAALAVFLVNGAVLIPLGLAAAAFNIAGNWLGSTFFDKKGALILRPIMLVVIVLFAIRLVTDLLA